MGTTIKTKTEEFKQTEFAQKVAEGAKKTGEQIKAGMTVAGVCLLSWLCLILSRRSSTSSVLSLVRS